MSSAGSISSVSSQLVQAQLSGVRARGEISTRIARKALDAQQAQGDAALSLLESAAQVARAAAESRPAAPNGSLDVTA
jgi:hypothetical protein